MIKRIFYYIPLILILNTSFTLDAGAAAKKAAKGEDLGINNETLTGGVLHEQGVYLPRATTIACTLRTPIDTRVSKVGDTITVQTTQDVVIGDYTLIPANTFIHGYIKELEPPKSMHRRPKLELVFDSASIRGKTADENQYIKLRGTVSNKTLLGKADRVNDGELYKSKAKKAAALGGVGGAVTGWVATELINPFASWGIVGMANSLLILGSGVGGAYLAAGMITKDDVRLEPGAELSMMLDETTIEVFEHSDKQLLTAMKDNIKDLAPDQAYDKLTTMESELVKGAKVRK